ncbi:MAG: hypothetical protein ACKOH7_04125 [Solirubrobacterales bacterium]
MAEPEKPSDAEENDVLSNLPRSRRQRPSAHREQARAAREANGGTGRDVAAGAGARPGDPGNGAATPRKEPAPVGAAGADDERPRKRVPASGYATVREPGSYGNADPDELLKGFVRGILRRLPG